MNRQSFMALLKATFGDWRQDNASLLAAGLSYYAILSLVPMLVLGLFLVARIYPEGDAQMRITVQIARLIGPRVSSAISQVLDAVSRPSGSTFAIVGSIITLFIGASGAFAQLMNALDVIWNVRPTGERGVLGTVLDRLLAFAMVLVVGLLLVGTFVATAVIARANRFVPFNLNYAPLWNILLSLLLTTALFAAIFKVLPRVQLDWRDVGVGAFVTAVLFVLGKELIGLYLGLSDVTSSYGAAGSIIVLLIFVYYAAQILLLGAEFTKLYARRSGRIVPTDEHAIRYRLVTEEEPAMRDIAALSPAQEVQIIAQAPGKRRAAPPGPEGEVDPLVFARLLFVAVAFVVGLIVGARR